MEKIAKDNEAIGHRVKSIEGKQCEFDDLLVAMQCELDDYKKTTDGELSDLREHLDYQENRACRKNLAGFPEGVKGKDTVAFIQEWLPKILDLEGEIFEVELVHRSLQQRPADSTRPCAIVIRLLCFSDMVKIIEAAQNKSSLQYGNTTTMIFRYVNSPVQKEKSFCATEKETQRKEHLLQTTASNRIWRGDGAPSQRHRLPKII